MNILIVFGSLLGKTKRTSILIGQTIKDNGFNVKVKDVTMTTIAELKDYDLVIFGSSTWDDGQLQFDFRPFNEALMKSRFAHRNYAIFALGGHRYPHFCTAATILEETVSKIEGNLLVPSLRLDFDHDEPMDKCDKQILEWTSQLITALRRL